MRQLVPPTAARLCLAPAVERGQDILIFLRDRLAPFLDLFVRIWLAQIFLTSGLLKTTNWPVTVYLYADEHPVPGLAPETAAVIGTGIELLCPFLLMIGLFTRAASLPLILTALFLQLTYKPLDAHLYWLALLALLFTRGAGAISLDHFIAPHLAASAVPFGGGLRALGRALSRYALPPLELVLRIWVASMLWTQATAAADGGTAIILAVLPVALLLAVGLATQPVALVLLLLVPVLAPAPAGSDDDILLAMLLAGFVLRGGGRLAVDAWIGSAVRRWFPSLSADTAWLAGAPRVVIVGAGFAGIAAARGLRHAWARVTLIDRRNYHLFQPLLYQVATASLSPADIATPIRSLLRGQHNAQSIMGRVTAVDTAARRVAVDDRSVPYDYLVLATGARHSYFGKDAWEGRAPGLKKIDDATAVRGRILAAFEQAETCDDAGERQRLLTFVIVGGGPTGVELAGAIAELARHGMHEEFRSVDPATARVILVQSAPRVLPVMPETLSDRARASLECLGVEVMVNARVDDIDTRGVRIGDLRIEAATVLWAAGVAASPAGRWIGAKRDAAGRIVVNADLSVPGSDGLFATGDTALCTGADGKPLPGLAAVAKQQGVYIAKLLRARIEGRSLPGPFRYRDYGSMATIGRKAAVADLRGIRLSGSVAWWLWGAVHVAFLVDVRSRIAVLLDWFWSYLTYNRGVRLITGGEQSAD